MFQRKELQKFVCEMSHYNIKPVALLLHNNKMQKAGFRVTIAMVQSKVHFLFPSYVKFFMLNSYLLHMEIV